ncbi:MAG: Acetoacetyl-CoA reductase [Gammaproteobacteria bacterium]|nr:Acetoacetyl-CoA reductase [Gammaproteobacteria bacterium]
MTEARFTVDVDAGAPLAFAQLSGDWNPLHTSAEYAARTSFGRPVLHGAYLTGLLSRLAGMFLPGEQCLLHGISLRFIAPVQPPVSLTVVGKLVEGTMNQGRVSVRIADAVSGASYAEGHYDFGLHASGDAPERRTITHEAAAPHTSVVLVTGASGALAGSLIAKLPAGTLGVSRSSSGSGFAKAPTIADIEQCAQGRRIAAIVHCAWPAPDNESLTDLTDIRAATEFNVAAPLRETIELAQLLKKQGTENSVLVLVGSTAAEPGRHNYRMPLYTLSKALVPTLCKVLATELAGSSRRCVAAVYDVIDGGMNSRISKAARVAHRDRSPFGRIASVDEAADQLLWILENRSFLASGSTLVLTGGAAP